MVANKIAAIIKSNWRMLLILLAAVTAAIFIIGILALPAEISMSSGSATYSNVTENDIKFAEGKLPNFLEGTILDGNTRVIVTSTGEPPEGLREGVDYDKVISIKEAIAIENEARERYIKKYGVDPGNPKIDEVNGTYLSKEEVERLVKSGRINLTE